MAHLQTAMDQTDTPHDNSPRISQDPTANSSALDILIQRPLLL